MRRGKTEYSMKSKGHLQCRWELADMLFDPSVELGLGIEFFRVGPRIDEIARETNPRLFWD